MWVTINKILPTLIIRNHLRFVIQIPRVRYYVEYTQGQSPQPRIREYFYYIDHHGMLFLDDARIKNFTSCFKDKKFLEFFFKRLRRNETNRYINDFPYLSLCGRERNYVRCDDLPIVFTHVIKKSNNNNDSSKNNNDDDDDGGKDVSGENLFSYGHAGESLVFPFQPNKLFMSVSTGRIYHPGPEIVGGIGLVRSQLAIEFSNLFTFENDENYSPTHFTWKSLKYKLDNKWFENKISRKHLD